MNGTVTVELIGVVLATLLCVANGILTRDAYRDWRAAVTWAERDVGRRVVASYIYRLIGKILIAIDLWLLFLARPHVVVSLRTFLTLHPLTLFFILEGALFLFFANDVGEAFWRRRFFDQARKQAADHPMTLDRLERLERLDRLLQEEEKLEGPNGEAPVGSAP